MKKTCWILLPWRRTCKRGNQPSAVFDHFIQQPEVTTSSIEYAEVTEYITGLSRAAQRQDELRQLLREVYPSFLTSSI